MAVTGTGVTFALGFTAGAAAAGVKSAKADRLDVALLLCEAPAVAAVALTTNQVIAAPCVLTRRHVDRGPLRAVVVNSGNANACTGEQGDRDALAMAEAAAKAAGVSRGEIAVASTGVIGVPLPVDRIARAIASIRPSVEGSEAFARAIMTTDTRPKIAEREVWLRGKPVRVGGTAKGAGMIHPNMATLLAFITTDARLDSASARRALSEAVSVTFNSISVDGDTSTNDMALLLASGASGIEMSGDAYEPFVQALTEVCADLARAVVADGEGATKVFEVRVRHAASRDEARSAARTISSSNLVKTAIHGSDPNWGRILAAAGRSGARVDQRLASIRIGEVEVFARGAPCTFEGAAVRRAFKAAEIVIDVDLGLGTGEGKAWGCDMSADYVRINSEYTT